MRHEVAGGVRQPKGEPSIGNEQLEIIGTTIASNLFWAHAHMLLALGGGLDHFRNWLSSCECHTFEEASRLRAPCPLVGRRAPDMAAGTWRETFVETLNLQAADLLPHTVQLTQEERNLLLRDFQRGRDAMMLAIEQKFAQWDSLPLMIAGVAHEPCHCPAGWRQSAT